MTSDGESRVAVGADQADEQLRDDRPADKAQPVAVGAVLGLLEDVEPQRGAVRPTRAHLVAGQRGDVELCRNGLAGPSAVREGARQ